ncbi:MAG: AI-2E family transporter [Candidatus Sericytochromatia bacterium]
MEDTRYRQTSTYITRLLLYALVIGLAVWMLRPFIMPMILASITASIFLKFKPRLPAKLTANANLFSALATLTSLLMLVLPLFLLLLLAGLEAFHFVQFVQDMLKTNGFSYLGTKLSGLETQLNAQLQAFGTSFNFKSVMQDALNQLQNLGTLLYNNALNLLNNTFMIGLNTFYFLFITFFLIRDGGQIAELIKRLLPFDRKTTQTLVDAVEHVGQTVLVGGLTSSLIFGTLMAFVFMLFGFGSPLMWGILLGILSLIPLGTVAVYIPSLIYLVFSNSIWVALLFLVVVELIEQVLFYVVIRPKFIDSRTRMYPLAIFLAIVSGITTFGPMGLVYGPLIMAALLALLEQQLKLIEIGDEETEEEMVVGSGL